MSLESAHICVVAPVFAGCGVEATEAETCPLFLCSGIWSLLAVISSLLKCSVLSVFVSLGIILTELSAFNVRKLRKNSFLDCNEFAGHVLLQGASIDIASCTSDRVKLA